jgi:hypothetical protein
MNKKVELVEDWKYHEIEYDNLKTLKDFKNLFKGMGMRIGIDHASKDGQERLELLLNDKLIKPIEDEQ